MQTNVDDLLRIPLVVINLGPKKYAKSLEQQRVEVVQMDWVPQAGGDKDRTNLQDQLF